MTPDPPHGVYVHVPWCRVHCPYCAFVVVVERDPDWTGFVDGVLRDHAAVAPAFPGLPDSLYLGGGTPSLLPEAHLARLLAGLPLAPGAEITMEVNPGTTDRARLQAACALGVNRLSLGVQSFTTHHARRLARGHDLRQAEGLLEDVAALPLATWSLDLMFALPGQTLEELDADLDRVLALRPPHVSLYGLTYEPGTPFHDRRAQGRLVEADEETWRAMYLHIGQRLQGAGWERYEVSNFARPGHRSRHNEACWRGAFYAGLGPGAHGYLPATPLAPWGTRTVNRADVAQWRVDPVQEVEHLDARTAAADLVLSTLRHRDGLPLSRLAGLGLTPGEAVVSALVEAGLITADPAHIRLTAAGVPLADGITTRLVRALRESDDSVRQHRAQTL